MGKENERGFIEDASYKLRNIEAGAAVVLAALGAFGWAGVMAVGAALDHAVAKAAEKWRKRGQKTAYA